MERREPLRRARGARVYRTYRTRPVPLLPDARREEGEHADVVEPLLRCAAVAVGDLEADSDPAAEVPPPFQGLVLWWAVEDLEELEAIRAYDEAKRSGDEVIPLEQALREIEAEQA